MPIPAGFAAAAAAAGAPLDAATLKRLRGFLDRLRAENEVQNLTAILEPGEMETDHLLDSLAIAGAAAAAGFRFEEGGLCVDIGSGGGFPGIPLAVAFPRTRWVLVESEGRKADWLERALLSLGLDGTEVIRGRGREIRHNREDLAGRCDVVTARAVGALEKIAREARGLLRPGGFLLCPKGRGLEPGEIAMGEREAKKSRLVPAGTFPMAVPGRERVLVVYRGA